MLNLGSPNQRGPHCVNYILPGVTYEQLIAAGFFHRVADCVQLHISGDHSPADKRLLLLMRFLLQVL